jgi:hypothetical protein
MRKRRSTALPSPPGVEYMLLPYLKLSGEERIRIVQEEENEGTPVWSEMSTSVNGQPTKVLASRKWGILILNGEALALQEYPLAELGSIQTSPGMKPVYEQHTIEAKYRCRDAGPDRLSFEPVEPQYPLGDGRTTELVSFSVNLNDELRKNFGSVSIGDLKEFKFDLQILAGYEPTVLSP